MQSFFAKLKQFGERSALADSQASLTYSETLNHTLLCGRELLEAGVERGSAVMLHGQMSAANIVAYLALIRLGCVVIPAGSSGAVSENRAEISGAQFAVYTDDGLKVSKLAGNGHDIYDKLAGDAGLVIFSSGSTGEQKAMLHNLSKYIFTFSEIPVREMRLCAVLMSDHIGGQNSIFTALSSASCLIMPKGRTPDEVCRSVEKHRADVLAASPTLLNLILMAEGHKRFDLSSLRTISYGTEPMTESLFQRLRSAFADVRFRQLYGTSESGICRSAKNTGGLSASVCGVGDNVRIVDGIVHIKLPEYFVGYLNYNGDNIAGGWLNTGDIAEEANGGLVIKGRQSELINVGGEKVTPAEVESHLLQVNGVADAAVYGIDNPITGRGVACDIVLAEGADIKEVKKNIRKHFAESAHKFMTPVKIKAVQALEMLGAKKRRG